MTCYLCGAEMKRVKKDVEAAWKGRRSLVRGVGAWVCCSCGEEAYEPDDVRFMQEALKGMAL